MKTTPNPGEMSDYLRDVSERVSGEYQWQEALRLVLEGKPQTNGEYLHLVECSGDRRQPPGIPGFSCCCRPSPKAVAIEREACANLALRIRHSPDGISFYFHKHDHAVAIAAAIRARGKLEEQAQ